MDERTPFRLKIGPNYVCNNWTDESADHADDNSIAAAHVHQTGGSNLSDFPALSKPADTLFFHNISNPCFF